MNTHNARLKQQGYKRRAKLLRQSQSGKTDIELAKMHKVSRQRIQWMLAKARIEHV